VLSFYAGQLSGEGCFDGFAFLFHRPLKFPAGIGEPRPDESVVVFIGASDQQALLAESRGGLGNGAARE